ncbi:MAG: hypothetical protein ABI597_04870 [Gammaproteobacteria bacterium]
MLSGDSNSSKEQLESEVNDLKTQLKESKSLNDDLSKTIYEMKQQFAANQQSFAQALRNASTANIATRLAIQPTLEKSAETETASITARKLTQHQTGKMSRTQIGWLMFFAGAAVTTVVTALCLPKSRNRM